MHCFAWFLTAGLLLPQEALAVKFVAVLQMPWYLFRMVNRCVPLRYVLVSTPGIADNFFLRSRNLVNGSWVSTLSLKIVKLRCDVHILSQRSCIGANIPLKFILALAHQSRYTCRRAECQNPIKWHRT